MRAASVLALICVGVMAFNPTEIGAAPRAKVAWTVPASAACDDDQARILPGRTATIYCARVDPGVTITDVISFETNADVRRPRLLRQTGNGANVIKPDQTALTDPLLANTATPFTLRIEVPAGIRAKRVSGRIYISERSIVLVPPLEVRVDINHPTPEEVARTPIVVPTNHIQFVQRPTTGQVDGKIARFNLRDMTVSHLTNLTWTNKDRDNRHHAVKGQLCDPTLPVDRSNQCALAPALISTPFTPVGSVSTACDVVPGAASIVDREPGSTGRILCFLSPDLGPENYYVLRVERPNPRQPLTYYMADGLGPADAMIEQFGAGQPRHPYVVVK